MAASFTEHMAKLILSSEESPGRFEKFCCDLYSRIDGCTYVPTSFNYDQGRDGRTTGRHYSQDNPILCVSLRKDPLVKMQEDALKIEKRPYPPKVVRCCILLDQQKEATEHLLDRIKSFFHAIRSVESVFADGVIQIAKLLIDNPGIFEKYYRSELEILRQALSVGSGEDDKIELTGMRIALTTQFSEDALTLRDDLLRNLILSVLSSGNSTINSICKKVSDSLRLPKGIYPEYFQAPLDSLIDSGIVTNVDSVFAITAKGKEELTSRTDEGAENLINGQQLFHDLILNLTGERLEPDIFSKVWFVIQDEIANLFLTNGIYVVQSIESIVSNKSEINDHLDLMDAIVRLAQRIIELDIWGSNKETVFQSIVDIFHETESDAFAWLSQIGTTYVSLCSLGLEPNAQEEVKKGVRDLDLLLDTDILLAFLSPGEAKHEAICTVVKSWQRINGNIYVTPCVMEETAYHAWISSIDYEKVWRSLGKYTKEDSHRLINNAFVRGFRVESKGKYAPKFWNHYILQFTGSHKYDYSKIETILKDEYIFLISSDNIDGVFAQQIQESLIEILINKGESRDEIDEEEIDKFRRDGLLLATLLKQRTSRKALIVSSSTRLCSVCQDHKDKLGGLEPVAPIAAIAYLLTMIPGTNMNLGTLKGILFDTGFAEKVKGIERVGLRILRSSEQYFFPFSKRATLRRELGEKIGDMATQLGRKFSDVRNDFEHGRLTDNVTAEIVAEAVDKITRSRYEKRIWELEQELKESEKKRR